MKNTKIICGFPGNGKTTLEKNIGSINSDLIVYDLDPSDYSGIGKFGPGRRENTEWPSNYLSEIIKSIGKVDVLMLTGDPVIVDKLVYMGYQPILVYPTIDQKGEYLQRYKNRSTNTYFVEFMDAHFELFVSNHEKRKELNRIVLQPGQYISDVLPQILEM